MFWMPWHQWPRDFFILFLWNAVPIHSPAAIFLSITKEKHRKVVATQEGGQCTWSQKFIRVGVKMHISLFVDLHEESYKSVHFDSFWCQKIKQQQPMELFLTHLFAASWAILVGPGCQLTSKCPWESALGNRMWVHSQEDLLPKNHFGRRMLRHAYRAES